MFIYLNNIKQHPLKININQLKIKKLYECNICFNDFEYKLF
jgi:hypothetical protein